SCLALAFGAGGGGDGGMIIWPLFGTTNQLLASLTLLILSVILLRQRRPVFVTLIPLSFVMVMATWALIIQLRGFWDLGTASGYFLVVMDLAILGATILVALEAFGALRRAKQEGDASGPPTPPSRRAAEPAGTA